MVQRIVQTLEQFGVQGGYFSSAEERQSFVDELAFLLLHQHAAFNTPVWLNLGVREAPQCSACFILAADDSIESLLELQRTEGLVFKHGSGTGASLSAIRSSGEELSGGGLASGPVSFMKAYDTWAAVLQSGGRQRRAARMQTLDCHHPDLLEFITCKLSSKGWANVQREFPALLLPSPAYSGALQNTTTSVCLDDEFMEAVESGSEFQLRRVLTGQTIRGVNARDTLRLIAAVVHACGEPGIQFSSTINSWHTVPAEGAIRSSNPCGEFQFIDNSACNLASINLVKYLNDNGEIDHRALQHTVQLLAIAQDILVEYGSYPTAEVSANSRALRPIGIGFTNLGALLMRMGLPYDSEEGRAVAAALAALISSQAYYSSMGLAARLAPFARYATNAESLQRIVARHAGATQQLSRQGYAKPILAAAAKRWTELLQGISSYGVRNAQVTAIAPTGTISLLMDCDTTGIEPELSLLKRRTLRDGAVIQQLNRSISPALKALGYDSATSSAITALLADGKAIEECKAIAPQHRSIFATALPASAAAERVSPIAQITMLAAVQPHISGAISKTVTMPPSATPAEIYDAILYSWRMGIKAISFYRDSSRGDQPLRGGAARHSAPL
jgi:ribonucleoside-diphosphate reductase alpha chain